MQNITCVLLIDKRLANYDEIIASANAVTACVVFDYDTDTFDTLKTRGIDRVTPENRVVRTWVANVEIESEPPVTESQPQQQQRQQQQLREYRNIGLMQHNTNGAQYFAMANEPGCQLDNVAESDPSLETWANYIDFINKCVRDYGLQTYDMMACALYSDANWKYTIDEMAARCGVSVRASLDNTGSANLKGDWFLLASNANGQEPTLETETVDLTTVYFTDEILKYNFVLASGTQGNVFIMDASGIPYCWGWNGWGHLAYSPDGGSTLPRVTTPIRYGTITDAVASAQSYAISAVLTSSGAVYTTGNGNYNNAFTLGPGRTTATSSYIPAAITSYGIVMQVACGYNYTMVLFTTGTIGGWGDNAYGQISGDGSTSSVGSYLAPSLNSILGDGGNSNFISIACGNYHTIAVKHMQTAFSWGLNNQGQCGRGNTTSPIAAGSISQGSNTIIKIAAWTNNTAVMQSTNINDVFACGYNGSNQLTPDAVSYYMGWVNITTSSGIAFSSSFYPVSMTGGDGSMQILMNNGTIYSKGYNATGIVGNGTISNDTNGLFLKADIITSAVAICNGQYSMTAITGDGRVYTWGSNSDNQLGDGTTTSRFIPTALGINVINAMSIGNTSGGFYSGIISSIAARAALAKITNLNTASLLYRYVGSKSSFNNGQLHNAVDNRRSILIVVKSTTGAIALGYFGPTLQATEYFQAAPIGQAWVCPFMAPDASGNTLSTVKYYNTKKPEMSALNQSADGIRIGQFDLIIGSQSTSTRPDSFETPPNGLLGAGTGDITFTMAEFEVFYAPQIYGAYNATTVDGASTNLLTANTSAALTALDTIVDTKSMRLLFKSVGATTDATAFHAAVDNGGPTLTIIKTTTGAIALAYSSVSWKTVATDTYISALQGMCWLCPFQGPNSGGNILSTLRYYNTIYPDNSMYVYALGFVRIFAFGGGHDLLLSNSGRIDLGNHSYQTRPSGLFGNGTIFETCSGIEVYSATSLITFTSHTFTPAGATRRSGPSLLEVSNTYFSNGAMWAYDTNYLNMSTFGIQDWTVPKTGKYTIEAFGAQGGNADTATGGLGARIKISTTLTKNNIIKILCGQQGGTASATATSYNNHPLNAGGGGGGTYIYNDTTTSLILIAGGGGGAAKGDLNSGYSVARYVLNGSNASAYNVTSGTAGTAGGTATYGNGGSNGTAGIAGTYGGSSGAGWNGSGSQGTYGGDVGLSFGSGGTGGKNKIHSGSFVTTVEGGFGGGSGAGFHENLLAVGGGGAGYSGGGGGGQHIGGGGGGGNYMIAGSTYISSSTNTGHGSVTITLVLTSPATLAFTKTAFYVKYLLNTTITLPATLVSTNNTDSYTLTHSSGTIGGNTGVATVSTAANVGTVTIKGVGKTTITSALAATANFDEITVTSIMITVVGSGTTFTSEAMTSVDLTSTDLTGSVFSSCDLTSANLYGATFNAATDLRTSTLTSLKSGRINGFTTLLPTGYKMI